MEACSLSSYGRTAGQLCPVFLAWISVMGLENNYLWTHSNAALQKERALLKQYAGKGG